MAVTQTRDEPQSTILSESLGCRLNMLERDAMTRLASDAGMQNAAIINSCAVTQEAVRQTHQLMRKIKRDDPTRKIILTGCAVNALHEDFGTETLILPNQVKLSPTAWQALAREDLSVDELSTLSLPATSSPHHFATPPLNNKRQTRGFLQIQNGCDHSCTFCIIPKGRGASVSRPLEDVIKTATAMVEAGTHEIVLTGVDLTSYHCPHCNQGLGALVKTLLKRVPKLLRLRLSSIDCIEIDQDLLDVIGNEPRFMPHLHLSVQAGDDLILKRMKRRHNRQDIITLCHHIRKLKPEIVFGADMIAGFPTETEAMFKNSCALFEDAGITHAHIFPFSPRPGTPAERMPPVASALIHQRAGILRQISAKHKHHHEQNKIGQVEEILLERGNKGFTRDYTLVKLEGAPALNLPRGALILVQVYRHDAQGVWGRPMLKQKESAAS